MSYTKHYAKAFVSRLSRALLVVALAIPFAHAQDSRSPLVERVQQTDNAIFVSGGTGDGSMERMNAMEKDYNLKILFAHVSGSYMSDVNVTVSQNGRQVFQTKTEGPVLLARLPAGSYMVRAEASGHTQQKAVRVANKGLKRMDFRWSVDH